MAPEHPPFVPKPGQVDFTHARFAPVINCVLEFQGTILIVQRSAKLNFYPNYWNGVSGFLDDAKTIDEKVHEELREELAIRPDQIREIIRGQIFEQEEGQYAKTWIVHPVLVRVATDAVKLDWEAASHRWITPAEATQYQLLPGFDRVLKNLRDFM